MDPAGGRQVDAGDALIRGGGNTSPVLGEKSLAADSLGGCVASDVADECPVETHRCGFRWQVGGAPGAYKLFKRLGIGGGGRVGGERF